MDEVNRLDNGMFVPNQIQEAAIDRLLHDPVELTRFISEALKVKNKPLAAGREAEILRTAEKRKDYPERVRALVEKKEARKAYADHFQIPDNLTHGEKRAIQYFLKPETEPNAEEENQRFINSLATLEGRRKLYLDALNRLEQADLTSFAETDEEQILKDYEKDGAELGLGFIMEHVESYMKSELASDLDDSIRKSPENMKSLCEGAGFRTSTVEKMEKPFYPVMSALTVEECLNVVSSVPYKQVGAYSPDMVLEIIGRIAGMANDLASRSMFESKTSKAVDAASKALAERKLLSGNLQFLVDGKAVDHKQGLEALGKGEPVTLRRYENYLGNSGAEYQFQMVGGRLEEKGSKVISRQVRQNTEVDPKFSAAYTAVDDWQKRSPSRNRFIDKDDKPIEQVEAVKRLAAGEEVAVSFGDPDDPARVGFRGKVKLDPDGKTLTETQRTRDLYVRDVWDSEDNRKQLEATVALIGLENGRETSFQNSEGRLIRRKEAIQQLAAGNAVTATVPDWTCPEVKQVYRLNMDNGSMKKKLADIRVPGNYRMKHAVVFHENDTETKDVEITSAMLTELIKYEAGRTPAYKWGGNITRAEALENLSRGHGINAANYDPKMPYVGKLEDLRVVNGKLEPHVLSVTSRTVDLKKTARTPEEQLQAMEDMKKALDTTHKTGYIGALSDSREFKELMTALNDTIKTLKNPKQAPTQAELAIKYNLLFAKAEIYSKKKIDRIKQRDDNDWVGKLRYNAARSLTSILDDNCCKAMTAYAAEKQASAVRTQNTKTVSNTKKAETSKTAGGPRG